MKRKPYTTRRDKMLLYCKIFCAIVALITQHAYNESKKGSQISQEMKQQ